MPPVPPISSPSLPPILTIGDPRLAQRAAAVLDPDHLAELQPLIDQLLASMHHSHGVGIAAPQIAASLRLFVVASRPTPRYPQAPTMEPTVMVNPQILAHSPEQVKDWEGCLSVPDRRGLVARYQWIEVAYQDRQGQPQRQVLTDFIARIFQHELDHLDGILFCDRVDPNDPLISDAEYQSHVVKALEALSATQT